MEISSKRGSQKAPELPLDLTLYMYHILTQSLFSLSLSLPPPPFSSPDVVRSNRGRETTVWSVECTVTLPTAWTVGKEPAVVVLPGLWVKSQLVVLLQILPL